MAKDPLFGEILVANGVITPEQLEQALAEQQRSGERLGTVLLRLNYIEEEHVFAPFLAQQLQIEYQPLGNRMVDPEVLSRIPASVAVRYQVLPLECNHQTLTVAVSDPLNMALRDVLSTLWNGQINMVFATRKDITEAVRQHYGVGAETLDALNKDSVPVPDQREGVQDITEIKSEASIGKFLNQILLEGYQRRATDIHIEPYEQDLKVRYRIDGVLYDVQTPRNLWRFRDSLASRIKIMARLNIAEKRMPQDGRFKVKVGDVDLDLRVSFMPSAFGESVVLRLLTAGALYNLKDLGLGEQHLEQVRDLLKRPHGIIFVTGPTGSGKTTTLYACLNRLNHTEQKIITIEDPIEYQIKDVIQIQVNPAIGLSFAAGLRSSLRHDPDVMMVGEVRDRETAEIAVQVALTGHLVFSTLHTNDAASAVTRLLDMGVEPYLIASAVQCFIAQRLVRRICPRCRRETKISAEVLKDLDIPVGQLEGTVLYEGEGCDQCHFSGYYGRVGVFEFLELDDRLRTMIMEKAAASDIRRAADRAGMAGLAEDGWRKVREGLTTPAELVRILKQDNTEM